MSQILSFLTEQPIQPEDSHKLLAGSGLAMKWYEAALAKIPAPGGGWNPALMPAARAAKRAGIKLDVFIADVKKATPAEIPEGRLKEINRAYERTDIEAATTKTFTSTATTEKPKPVMLPIPVENETESFLRALFEPDETIVICPGRFNKERNREEPEDFKREAKTRDEWIATFDRKTPSDYFRNDVGIYVKINPLQAGQKPGTKLPLADEASITAFRWLLVESDTDTKEEQLGAIRAAGIPYATIVDSGKKSLHAIVRIDADDRDDFKKQAAEVYAEIGKLLTVDPGNSHASRYSRLPGCRRGRDSWQALLEVYDDVPSYKQNLRDRWLTGSYTLAEYYYMEMPKETTLLGNRFLCREGSMLFVGPSGIGKSSASVQCDVLWSLGQPAFDIAPAFPLKVLCVQAENDDGDMIEMTRGIMHGLHLTEDQIHAVGENTLYRNYKDSTGIPFLIWLEKLISAYRPDIVRIDPLQAYLGDDAKEVKAVSDFFRVTLNPILTKHQCASIIAHHTPKTNHRNTEEWQPNDWMYAGAGAADLTNWARSVIVIDPVADSQELFRFIAAKRWQRIGWKGPDGEPINERFFKHATGGSIYWHNAETPTKAEQGKRADKMDVYNLVTNNPIPKTVLITRCQDAGAGRERARSWIAEMVFEGKLFEFKTKRSRARDEVMISKQPQETQPELPPK